VRKNLVHFLNHKFEYALILSGDQLYRMDFSRMITEHANSGAECDGGDDAGDA
jgi:glucose-1-phosphate adenylyltransferase